MTLKLVGWGVLAAAVVFGAGWFMGASGRASLEQERREAIGRAEFAEARGRVLEGRVHLFQSNFGQATKAFDAARVLVTASQTRLRQAGDAVRAGQLEVAIAQLREAQQLSLALNSGAQAAADEALRVIDAVSSTASGR